MDYKSTIESKYNRNNWMLLLTDIFGNRAEFWQAQSMIRDLDHMVAQWAIQLGKITLKDDKVIAVYEVELAGSVQLERNRAAIRNLLCTHWRSQGCAGAFMFCQRKEESVLRFSYVSEAWTFKEDGSYVKEATEPRRYTYYLGEGHRSRTAIDQFTKLKNSDFTLNALTKAFSVEAISDMFFDGYKKQYEDIILYITGKKMVKVGGKWEEKQMGEPCAEIMAEFARFENPEKSVRDYVKRLMGRLVFIQFLQKKGWMGVPAGDSWLGGDKEFLQHLFINSPYKDTFVDDVLEPLFSDLNTRRGEDLVSSDKVGVNIKVPYLNGGLFERSADDDTAFPLPARYMQSLIVDFFAAYNFTIDENDPNDAEVGVDAEMLGRIFENLLEDNKDKGAFYTPKEIVQYMCRESLIAYLQTETGIEEARLRKFVTEHDIKDCIAMNERQPLTKALHEVKICDPAIGSGAFPMGLLNELVACRAALGEDLRLGRAKIKRDIIQNNIYGVDIERGAVDIARLRFWLSLIVDEDNPEALPNMDFKIVQGNSLITTFNGKYLDLSGENTSPRQKNAIEALVKKLNQAQKEYFRAIGEVKLLKGIEIKSLLLDIVASQFGHELRSLAQSQDNSGFIFGDASAMTTKDIAEKANLSADMQEILNAGKTLRAKLNDETIPVAERAKLELNFFDWKIMFADVFEGKGGFDIVIGNPPYIQLQTDIHQKGLDHKGNEYDMKLGDVYSVCNFETYEKTGDIYCLFYEHGINILRRHGVLCYITSNKWMRAGYGMTIRNYLANNCNPVQLLDFAGTKIFENATVDVNILIVKKEKNIGMTKSAWLNDTHDIWDISTSFNQKSSVFSYMSSEPWTILPAVDSKIKTKIETLGKPLGSWDLTLTRGIGTGFDEAYTLTTEQKDHLLASCSDEEIDRTRSIIHPLLRGREINKYSYSWTGLWMIYIPVHFPLQDNPNIKGASKEAEAKFAELYPTIYNHICKHKEKLSSRDKKETGIRYEWYCMQRARYEKFGKLGFSKIVYQELSQGSSFALDEAGDFVLNNSAYYIHSKYDDDKYLIAILNSKLIEYAYSNYYCTRLGKTGVRWLAQNIVNLPIIEADVVKKDIIVNYVSKILFNNDTLENISAYEKEIDNLVYVLYDLTYDEVKVVEPEFPMTEAEYNEFKQQHQDK